MVTRGSSIYEAELIDRVTAPARQIVQALAALEAAFNSVGPPSALFANNMHVISAAMRNVATTAENRFSTRLGMHFNRLSELSNQLGTAVGRSMELIGRGMRDAGLAGVAATTALAVGLYKTIEAASAATETFNAFRETFGGANSRVFKEAVGWTEQFARSLGRSSTQTQQSLMTFQALFKGLGATNEEASKMSKSMTTLAADFGSFFNKSDEESLQRFIAALSGSSEVLDSFGINIREAALEAKGLQLGLGGNVRKMTEMSKTIIRASIIADVMKKIGAEGDALRTKFQWANQLKALGAAFTDLKIAIGNLAITELLKALQATANAFRFLVLQVKQAGNAGIRKFIDGLLAVGGISVGLVVIGTAFMAIGSAIAIASLALAGFLTTLGAIVSGGSIAALLAGVTVITSAFAAFGGLATIIGMDYKKLFDELENRFNSISKTVNKGREIIINSMATGDWSSAWDAFRMTAENVFIDLAFFLTDILAAAVESAKGVASRMMTEGRFFPEKKFFGDDVNKTVLELLAERQLKNEIALDDLKNKTKRDADAQAAKEAANAKNNAVPPNDAAAKALIEKEKQAIKAAQDAERKAALMSEGLDLTKSLRTPLEIFRDGLLKVNELFNEKAIDKETAKRAQSKLAEDLIDSEKAKQKFQAASITGAFTNRIANSLSKFAPSFDPMLKETQKQTQILHSIQQNTQQLKIAVF